MESIFLTEIKMTLKKAYLVFSFVFMVKEISIKWFKNERIIFQIEKKHLLFLNRKKPLITAIDTLNLIPRTFFLF